MKPTRHPAAQFRAIRSANPIWEKLGWDYYAFRRFRYSIKLGATIKRGLVVVLFSKRAKELKNRIPCLYFAVFGLVSVSQLGCAAPQSEPGDIATSTSSSGGAQARAGFTLDTPIKIIAADPGGAAVLNKDVPALLANPNYSDFKGMSLNWVASMSRGKLSQEKLAQIEADLQALGKQVAGDQ